MIILEKSIISMPKRNKKNNENMVLFQISLKAGDIIEDFKLIIFLKLCWPHFWLPINYLTVKANALRFYIRPQIINFYK